MSRICLVGMGAPAFLPSRYHTGAGLRTAHFTTALVRSGHETVVVYVADDGERADPEVMREVAVEGARVRCVAVSESDFDAPGLRAALDRFEPDALVGVTAYAAALATRLEPEVPFWADVFGDLMAEAQSKALACGDDTAIVRFWTTLRPVLERADRFSAVSRAQADALVGQLGLVGRLGAATAGEPLVSTIPCAAERTKSSVATRDSGLRGTIVPDDAFVVLWSGSFNTWCDVETLFAGLETAMDADPDVYFVATGGCVAGHDETTYPRLCELVAGSRHASRYHLLGWVPAERLPVYYRQADVGVNVERDLYERRLGSENRVVQWMAYGLPCITTARSELGRCLASRSLAFACPPADPAALARLLGELAADRERVGETGRACAAACESECSFDRTARSLVAWCERPQRAGDARHERPLTVGIVSEPAAMVRLLEAYLAQLSLGQVAYRSLRWLWRRLARRAGG